MKHRRLNILIAFTVMLMAILTFLPAHAGKDSAVGVETMVRLIQADLGERGAVAYHSALALRGDEAVRYAEDFPFLRMHDIADVMLMLPQSACDDASECGDAVEDVCQIINPTGVVSVTFNSSTGCSGRCGSVTVEVTCSSPALRPRPIVVDDGAPI